MATHRTLNSSFTVPFSVPSSDANADSKTVALSQVEGTSCDDIEFILYNRKKLHFILDTTAGSYRRLANVLYDGDESVVMSDAQSVGVSTPGVIRVFSMEVIGDVLVLQQGDLVPNPKGKFVFDMEAEEVKYTGGVNVFAVIRIKYRSSGTKYKYIWPADKNIKDALIVVMASDGSKASLQVSRADCTDDGNKYGDSTSENKQLQFQLNIETPWSATNSYTPGDIVLGALLYIYPVHTAGTLEFKVSFGKTGSQVDCLFSQISNDSEMKQLSESVNFGSSAIANLRCFVASFSDFSIAAESTFYDTKGNVILSPDFAGPGDVVTVEEYKDVQQTIRDANGQQKQVSTRKQVRYTKRLGPTEVAVINPNGVLLPALGVARVNYQVPMRVGALKMPLKITPDDFKQWSCTIYASYLYTDPSLSPIPIAFMGQASCNSPLGSSPAQDARELKLKELLSL